MRDARYWRRQSSCRDSSSSRSATAPLSNGGTPPRRPRDARHRRLNSWCRLSRTTCAAPTQRCSSTRAARWPGGGLPRQTCCTRSPAPSRYPYAEAFFPWRNQPGTMGVLQPRRSAPSVVDQHSRQPAFILSPPVRIVWSGDSCCFVSSTTRTRAGASLPSRPIGGTDYQVAAEISSRRRDIRGKPTGFHHCRPISLGCANTTLPISLRRSRVSKRDNSVTFTITDDAGRAPS